MATLTTMDSVTSAVRKLVLLVGTVKGIFRYESDAARRNWQLSGPHLGGWEIFTVCGDPRRSRILAGTGHFMHGPTIRTSNDGGMTWEPVARDPKFPEGSAFELKHIWQLVPGHPSEPVTWYAGVDDAALFVSRDDAQTWSELDGLVPDGALKVWRSRDQGRSWRAMTAGLPQQDHHVGVLRDAMTSDALEPAGVYLGTTSGELFHSRDDGETWERLPGQLPRITTLKTWWTE